MAAKSKADKTKAVTVDLQGVATTGHPRWGVNGRPILVGDACRHDGRKATVRKVTPTMLTIKYSANAMEATAHVNEVRRPIEVVETLRNAERWPA